MVVAWRWWEMTHLEVGQIVAEGEVLGELLVVLEHDDTGLRVLGDVPATCHQGR